MYCQMRKSTFLKFINQWKSEESLWNMKCPDYTDKHKKGIAYTRLMKILEEDIDDVTVDYVRKKVKSLKSTFYRERKKEETLKNEGKTDYVSKLWYFSDLSFLSDLRSSFLSDDEIDIETEEESILHRPIKSEYNESEIQKNEVSLKEKTEKELQALDATSNCTSSQPQLHVNGGTGFPIVQEQNELQALATMSNCTNYLPQLYVNGSGSAIEQAQNELQRHILMNNSTTNQPQLVSEGINSPIQRAENELQSQSLINNPVNKETPLRVNERTSSVENSTENSNNGTTMPQINLSSQTGSDECGRKRRASCGIEQAEHLYKLSNETKKEDEFDIMGQNIGCKMRRLAEKSQETAMMVECLIYQVIALGHRDQITEHTMIADTRRLINPYGPGTGPSSSMIYYMNRPPPNPSNSNNRSSHNLSNINNRSSHNSPNFHNLPYDPSIFNHHPPHNTANFTNYPHPPQNPSNFNNRPFI